MTLAEKIVHGTPIYKTLDVEVKDVSTPSAMRLQFVVSTEEVDRDGDVLLTKSWSLTNFSKNPRFMWVHDYSKLPIGRCIKTWVDQNKNQLNTIVEFVDDAVYDENYRGIKGSTVYKFYVGGWLAAVSAGFFPVSWEAIKSSGKITGGTRFTSVDLIEVSAVPVPSNVDALLVDSNKNFSEVEIKSMKAEMRRWLKDAEKLCSCTAEEKALGVTEDTAGGVLVPEGQTNKGEDKMKKGAISFEEAHKGGTPLADKDKPWNAAAERSAASTAEHFRAMHAGFVGGDEADKENYEFPHHSGVPPHEVHLKAVKKIAKAFAPKPPEESPAEEAEETQEEEAEEEKPKKKQHATQEGDADHLGYTENDNAVIREHMVQHLEGFKEPLPWDTSVEGESGSDVKKDVEVEKPEVETPETLETKGVIGYKKTPLADEGAPWDGPAQVAEATVDDLKVMCAWFDSGADPENKGAYKLPHHNADGQHSCVWNGVRAAGGAVSGARTPLKVPEGDLAGIKSHLEKHYHEFDKTAPWEPVAEEKSVSDSEEGGHVTKIGARLSKESLGKLNEAMGHFSEGFGHHDKGIDFHNRVTKSHAKALEAHDEAMKCYNKGMKALKAALEPGAEEAEENTEPEGEEPVTPKPEVGKPEQKSPTEPEEEQLYTVNVSELGEIVKELVIELKKQYNLT